MNLIGYQHADSTPAIPETLFGFSSALIRKGYAFLSWILRVSMARTKSFMSRKSYYELLSDPRWQKKRLEILNAADWKCQGCAASELRLSVHHFYYLKNKPPWEVEPGQLAALCDDCHEMAESCRLSLLRSLSKLDIFFQWKLSWGLKSALESNTPADQIASALTYALDGNIEKLADEYCAKIESEQQISGMA